VKKLKDWKEEYQKKLASPAEAAGQIESGNKIIVAPVNSLPIDILNALSARKEELRKVKIFSNLFTYPFDFLKGDYAGHITYYSGYFGPLERMFLGQGNVVPYPMHLSKSSIALERAGETDVAMCEVTPPDDRGYMNFGPSGIVYGRFMCQRAKKVIVQVNRKTPWVHGMENVIHVNDVDCIVEADHDLVGVPEIQISETEKRIGEFIAERIPDGACIQLGVGGIPNAVAYSLKNKKDLGVHTEALSDAVAELSELGVVNGSRKTIYKDKIVVGGLIIGTQRLIDFVNNNPSIASMPIAYVNDYNVIRQNDFMCSINAALTVDLTGQVASESIGHTQYSATGGQVDFVRGATAAKGGQSFIALKSSSKKQDGTLTSRIVLNLTPGTIVTTPRSDVMYIVTEYGVADLYMKSVPDRVKAMIAIAHPDFREQLEKQATEAGLLIPACLAENI